MAWHSPKIRDCFYLELNNVLRSVIPPSKFSHAFRFVLNRDNAILFHITYIASLLDPYVASHISAMITYISTTFFRSSSYRHKECGWRWKAILRVVIPRLRAAALSVDPVPFLSLCDGKVGNFLSHVLGASFFPCLLLS